MTTNTYKPLTEQIPIWLTTNEKRSLDAYAKWIGTSSQRLIEVLIADFCDYWDHAGSIDRNASDVCVMSETGIKALGSLMRQSREQMGWTTRGLVAELALRTGFHLANSAVTDLENGNREPQWNTLAKLASLNYIKSPEGKPYSVSDLFYIACEVIDPATGAPNEGLAAVVWGQMRSRLGEG